MMFNALRWTPLWKIEVNPSLGFRAVKTANLNSLVKSTRWGHSCLSSWLRKRCALAEFLTKVHLLGFSVTRKEDSSPRPWHFPVFSSLGISLRRRLVCSVLSFPLQ